MTSGGVELWNHPRAREASLRPTVILNSKDDQMEGYRWFWGILTFVTLAWYSSVTLYVSYKGLFDIRDMLRKLSSGEFDPESHGT